MAEIIESDNIPLVVSKTKTLGKKIVLVGGCFDMLHAGHIGFLELAKKEADLLVLLLESDENVKRIKGEKRPINPQKIRSIVLSSLKTVDFIIALKGVTKDEEYDKLIVQIKPDVIAITESDPAIAKRQEQAGMVGARLKVIKKIRTASTSDLVSNI